MQAARPAQVRIEGQPLPGARSPLGPFRTPRIGLAEGKGQRSANSNGARHGHPREPRPVHDRIAPVRLHFASALRLFKHAQRLRPQAPENFVIAGLRHGHIVVQAGVRRSSTTQLPTVVPRARGSGGTRERRRYPSGAPRGQTPRRLDRRQCAAQSATEQEQDKCPMRPPRWRCSLRST